MKAIRSVARGAGSFRPLLVFAPAAFLLLAAPLGAPIQALHDGFGHVSAVLTGVIDWVAILTGIVYLGKAAVSRGDDLATMSSRYLLFVFAVFFAVERIGSIAMAWPHVYGVPSRLAWIQGLGSIGVALGAVWLLPRLRNVREGAAKAQRDHARFLAAAENALDDFYIFDGMPDESGEIVDFRFSYINPNAERRLGVKRDSLIGKILTETRPFMVKSGLIEKYIEVVRTGEPFTCEVFLDDEMIQSTWLNVQVVKLGNGIAITSRDITEYKRLTEHVNYLAHYDQLTGLPNRTLLTDRLQQAILGAHRHGKKVAVFLIDIDFFKHINDTMGHMDGDALLASVAARLRSAVRETDTVARMGGDEFVVVMPEFTNWEDVRQCGEKIIDGVSRPITIGSREVTITLSIGVAICPDHGEDADRLLRAADQAMYGIKDAGRNGLRIFGQDASVVKKPANGGGSVHLPKVVTSDPVPLPVFRARPGGGEQPGQ